MKTVTPPTRILLTGATGAVGRPLVSRLIDAGHEVTCLVRDPARAALPQEVRVARGDVLTGEGLDDALEGAQVAYYLVHSMGGQADFAAADRQGARAFADAASGSALPRLVYLGGLRSGGRSSEHLRSREEVAAILMTGAPEFVHVRAAMVIAADSASFRMLRDLVRRLPAMVGPRWIDTPTQPIAGRDVTTALAALATYPSPPPEVELGGAEVLTYREMMRHFAAIDGRRPPLIVPVPLLSPHLSSHWVGFVTSVDAGLARPLVDGLGEELVVHTPPPAGINDTPLNFDDAVRDALASDSTHPR